MAAEKAAEDAAEAAAQAQFHPADAIGAWMARLSEPDSLARITEALIGALGVVAIAAIVYAIVMAVFRRIIARIECELLEASDKDKRRGRHIIMILELARSISKWVIFLVAFIWALATLGYNVMPLLAGAGIAGVAIAFGAQNVVRDLMSGFFILLEGQYTVGDYIQVGASFGMVEGVGVRTTILKDLDNQLHHIPNGTIGAVTVYEEPFVNYVCETPISDPEQSAKAAEVISQVGARLKDEYRRYLPCVDDAETVISDAKALVRLPVAAFPTQEWIVNEELPKRIKQALSQNDIPLVDGWDVRTYADLSRMPE